MPVGTSEVVEEVQPQLVLGCETSLVVIALFVVAVLLFTYLGVRSGRLSGRSCCSGPWPPDDLSCSEPRGEDDRPTSVPTRRRTADASRTGTARIL